MAEARSTVRQLIPHPTVDDRRAVGRAARQQLKRRDLGELVPPAGRDPVAILTAQEQTRVPELVPLRRERMSASPFTFYRGAAAIFSADIAPAPRSGLGVQLCGDAHLANFGGFASPERTIVFDLNDFDETLPGPFEWDVKRLAASFEVAGRSNGFDAAERERHQLVLARSYSQAMARFAGMDHLDLWYMRLSTDEVLATYGSRVGPEILARVERNLTKGRTKDRLKALRRLTVTDGGEVRFASDPPVLQPISELMTGDEREQLMTKVHQAFQDYRRTLQPDRRRLLERYRFVDLARKVVGVGSVGTRCWVALLLGREDGDPLFLQVKEAETSVLEPHLAKSAYVHQGRRVVEGQRMVQSSSDIFLGWERVQGLDGRAHDHYFRQLWDGKISPDIDAMDPLVLGIYAELCGQTLARAHARSGDPVALSAYLGGGRSLGEAMAAFSSAYADLNERDHAAAVDAWGTQASVGLVR
jgi:uncharacterized protein (DUF2252 family)